jgi:hypothetical protein
VLGAGFAGGDDQSAYAMNETNRSFDLIAVLAPGTARAMRMNLALRQEAGVVEVQPRAQLGRFGSGAVIVG